MPSGNNEKLRNGTLENRDGRDSEGPVPDEPLLDETGIGLLDETGAYLYPEL